MANKTRLLIVFLVLIIVVLVGLLLFIFLIRPQVTGYTTQKQVEGYQIALADIIRVVSQCQAFPVPVGNQTINLIALECLQLPAQAQQPSG